MYPEGNTKKAGSGQNSKRKKYIRMIVGIVVFDGEKFLLLHRVLNWKGWEFPKGHREEAESVEEAIKRELFEETGIPKFEIIGKIDDLNYRDKFRNVESHVDNYLVRVSSNTKITFANQPLVDGKQFVEHDDYKWCFPTEAVSMMTHENMKETMRKAIMMLGLEVSQEGK